MDVKGRDYMITRKSLLRAFDQSLPGQRAQFQMSPISNASYRNVKEGAKIAAVMAIINFATTHPNLILIQRTSKELRDIHAGQISLPGGKQEFNDHDLLATALRETHEEIGVPSNKIEILGPLTPLYIPVSGFHVYPFVGIAQIDDFVQEIEEVESIIQWPLASLLSKDAVQFKDLNPRKGIHIKDVPYFDCQGHVLWGATAMMLSELRVMLNDIN